MEAMKIEINLSHNYKSITLSALTKLSQFHNDKAYVKITNNDIIAHLNFLRKSESIDPLHRWIEPIISILRFFHDFSNGYKIQK